ncbi:MAG: aminotransferase class III-fold pyridoxal phosphate-dependent enzyme [Pseudomonadota bacterium]|nr:aminotransferase class III-fold pyridoxal phosphate-dependent enzyme [Pseudomonadota bacterium]
MGGNTRDGELRERARRVIPNGMYGHESTARLPDGYPQFFDRAEGARLWDVDGAEYVDWMCAYGPNLLGYGQPDVLAAVEAQQRRGDTLTGPGPAMVELAEAMVDLVSHADWAMFCKNGGDATSMAMVTARAHRGRRKILVGTGAYHGASPWNTPVRAGVTEEDRAHLIYFEEGDLDSLADAARAAGDDFAGLFVTPYRMRTFMDQTEPDAEFARGARAICDAAGALLIVDDVRSGLRVARDCSWETVGVRPDLSCWGKVIGNGQPISALLGSEVAREAAGRIFVTGSFWFSAAPMAGALETLRIVRETDYLERLTATGEALRAGLAAQAAGHGFGLRQTGPSALPMVLFEEDPDFRLGYAWCAAALRAGAYLSPYHNMFANAAMTEADVARTLEATDAAFEAVKRGRDGLSRPPQVPPQIAPV